MSTYTVDLSATSPSWAGIFGMEHPALDDYARTLAAVRHEAGIRRRFLDGAPDTWTALALAGACRTVEARLTAAGVA